MLLKSDKPNLCVTDVVLNSKTLICRKSFQPRRQYEYSLKVYSAYSLVSLSAENTAGWSSCSCLFNGDTAPTKFGRNRKNKLHSPSKNPGYVGNVTV